MTTDDELFLMEDDADDAAGPPWRILIVDDDPDVHAATEMALMRFTHLDRPLQMDSAHSGKAAMSIVTAATQPYDLVLLDVVMDTPTDGLDTARSIREFLDTNSIPYIIIRTGQPAYAAEAEVMKMPEVNAYLSKGRVTLHDLLAAVRTGLDEVSASMGGLSHA